MPAKRTQKPSPRMHMHWIHSSRLHVVMYSMLLVATPFLMLANFLQEAIGKLSRASVELSGTSIPVVPVTALIVATVLLIVFRAHITRLRMVAGAIAVVMIAMGQAINDYYFDHKFYDLQQNWHYIAYAIFCFLMYRDLAPRGYPLSRIILITYLCGVSFSSFDEALQLRISNRAFEMGDIAKDAWGALMGLIVLLFGENRFGALALNWRPVRHSRLSDYFRQPSSLLILLFVLSYLLLCLSSLLGEVIYAKLVIILTIIGFVVFFLLLHISQYRGLKYGMLTLLLAGIGLQAYSFVKYRGDYIVHQQPGLVVYKGIPIFFFDVMIFPDGTFRPVDRKEHFRQRDRMFFLKQKTDIIVIGSGTHGEGGNGFPGKWPNQFLYNRYTKGGIQLIILKNPQACELFNRLKREQKNVLFILHNTA